MLNYNLLSHPSVGIYTIPDCRLRETTCSVSNDVVDELNLLIGIMYMSFLQ